MKIRIPLLLLALVSCYFCPTSAVVYAKPAQKALSQKTLDAALVDAVYNGDTKRTKSLLARGASANARGKDGDVPLVVAGYINTSPYQEGPLHSFELFKLLLDHGADVNAADYNGNTALISVAAAGEVRAAKLLLAKGARLDARSHDGTTAFMAAASSDVEIVQFLLAKGARINDSDNAGVTPLMAATSSSQEGGDYSSPDIVKFLLAHGADVNASDKNGATALIYAANMSTNNESSDRDTVETTKILLSAGADVKARTQNGNTALKWAKVTGKTAVVRLLQRAGAKI